MKKILRIGTRGSRLALVQTNMVASLLRHQWPELEVEVVEIKTSGDWKPEHGETPLKEDKGGKALFAKEIEQAMMDGVIDCGVHSLKDMPALMPEGLSVDHMLPRENPFDAFLSNGSRNIEELPVDAVIGTSSPRRQAYLKHLRPDIKTTPLRGNVPTRIEKLRAGAVDATILAVAGLKRLGLEKEISAVLPAEIMLPAAGQGAVCIETRSEDHETRALFDFLHCEDTGICCAAEREAVKAMEGSCYSPIGAYAVIKDGCLELQAAYATPNGEKIYKESGRCEDVSYENAQGLGQELGLKVKSRLDKDLP